MERACPRAPRDGQPRPPELRSGTSGVSRYVRNADNSLPLPPRLPKGDPVTMLPTAAAAILLILGGCATRLAEQSPVEEGRQIAERRCSSCHAIALTDASRRPDAPPLRDLLQALCRGRRAACIPRRDPRGALRHADVPPEPRRGRSAGRQSPARSTRVRTRRPMRRRWTGVSRRSSRHHAWMGRFDRGAPGTYAREVR